MKIGIVITSFNNEETLEKAIKSAAILKKNNTIYIVLIDDCSTDSSIEIARLAKKKNLIDLIYINKKNLGISRCRNIGIRLSQKTDYITFLDGDDFINPKITKILTKKIYGDLIAFNFDYLNKDKILKNYFYNGDKELMIKDIKKYFYNYLIKPNKNSLFTTCWAKLYKTKLFKLDKTLQFNEKLHICEDTDFVFRFLFKAKNIQYINFSMYLHSLALGKKNLNKATFGTKKSLQHQTSFLKPVESCKQYLIKNKEELLYIQKKIDHCIAAYTIIYTIRSCIRINSFLSFFKTYKFWKKIYRKKLFYNAIRNYSPKLANGGVLIPYLIKKKIYFMAILTALLFAKKRYL